jgi:hypothetical protein
VRRGGGEGSDLRHELVTLCKRRKIKEYNELTNRIIYEYQLNGTNDFLNHVREEISTFRLPTLLCLELVLTRFQEEAIADSMEPLAYILNKKKTLANAT